MRILSQVAEDENVVVASIHGDTRFISRITSIGLTPGCSITMLKNDIKRPILIYSRDTVIALNRKDCESIEIGGER